MSNQIARKIYDEGHQILTNKEFRKQHSALRELMGLEGQTIVLTASLPVRLEAQLLEAYALSPSTLIIRAPSTQKNISYGVMRLPKNASSTTFVVDLVRKIEERLLQDDRLGLIFCRSRWEVQQISGKLGCFSSESQLDPTVKRSNEQSWQEGHHKWMVATTGLIHGIDVPNIGVVLFVGLPYGLLNLYQGSGRAGRDGRHSWSILIDIPFSTDPDPGADDVQGLQEGLVWTQGRACRQMGMGEYMDGKGVHCSDIEGAHSCDGCDTEHPVYWLMPHLNTTKSHAIP